MKKMIIPSVVLFCVCFFSGALYGAELFETWQENQWKPENPVQFVISGTSVNIAADGSKGEPWGALTKKNDTAIGIIGSFKLGSVNGLAQCGLEKTVGSTAKGSRIQAQIFFQIENHQLSIRYRVRERDSETSVTLRQISSGTLGNWDGDYAAGDTAILAFALVGNEIWFYTPKNESIVKCQLLFDLTPINEQPYRIFAWTETGSTNRIVMSVSDVNFF